MALDRSLLDDAVDKDAVAKAGVQRFESFLETTYRLVFAYEDRYPKKAQNRVLTIEPSGTVKGRSELGATKGKALVTYGFPQTIAESKLQLLESEPFEPFIWDRADRSYALVQTWKNEYDNDWKGRFLEYTENKNPLKWNEQAVSEFHKAMIRLFGDDAKSQNVTFAVQSQTNKQGAYVGRWSQLKKLLESSERIRASLKIAEFSERSYTTEMWVKNRHGEVNTGKSRCYKLDLDEMYVLYTKQGGTIMACHKTLKEFYAEAAFLAPCKDCSKIPNCLLASPLPPCSYASDVARLFFNDAKLIHSPPLSIPDIPRPIRMEHCVGPAVPWAFWRAVCLWSVVGTTTAIRYILVDNQLLDAPLLLLQRVLFVLAVLYGFFAEWQCVTFFIVPFVERVQGCQIPVFGKRSFYVWLPLMFIMSGFEMLSILTNAEFMLGVIRRERVCAREVTLWINLMEASIFGCLGIDWEVATPAFFAGFCWVVSLVQLFWPLLDVAPVRTLHPRFRVMCDYENDGSWETWTCRLGIREQIRPCEALLEMAFAGGMCTIGCGAYAYPLGYMRDELRQKGENWAMVSMEKLHLAQRQAVKTLFCAGLLKKTLQLKIQVTLYALHRSMLGTSNMGWIGLIQIIVTLLTGLASEIDVVKTCLTNYQMLEKEISAVKLDKKGEEMLSKLKKFSRRIIALGIVIALIVGYSCLQLVCLYSCSTSLWNLSGCVTEEDFYQFASGNLNCSRLEDALCCSE